MTRSLRQTRPDGRLLALTTIVLFALLTSLVWNPASFALDGSTPDPIDVQPVDDVVDPDAPVDAPDADAPVDTPDADAPEPDAPVDDPAPDAPAEPAAPAAIAPLTVAFLNNCTAVQVGVRLTNPNLSTDLAATVIIDGQTFAETVPADSSIRVRVPAVEDATYAIRVLDGSGGVLAESSILRNCEDDPVVPDTPSATATIDHSCASGTIVTIVNNGSESSSYDVKVDGVTAETVTVAAGDTAVVVVELAEDTTSQVKVKDADDNLLARTQVSVDCEENPPTTEPPTTEPPTTEPPTTEPPTTEPPTTEPPTTEPPTTEPPTTEPPSVDPIVSIDHDCTSGTVVTVTNPGTDPAAIAVLVNAGVVDTYEIAPGETITVNLTLREDRTSSVVVRTIEGERLAKSDIAVDCVPPLVTPTITFTHVCQDTSTVTVTNPGDVAVTVDVRFDGRLIDTLVIQPGATDDSVVDISRNPGSLIRVIDANGELITSAPAGGPDGCDQPLPEVSFSHDCTEGATITITNPGTKPEAVAVLVNGGVFDTFELAAGETISVEVDLAEDETSTIAVRLIDGTDVASTDIAVDCEEPADPLTVTIVHDCATGTVVTAVNNSDEPNAFAVLVNGGVVDTYEIAPGQTVTVILTLPEDETSTVQVRSIEGEQLASADITVDCEQPQPDPQVDIDHNCTDGTTVTVTNPGDEPVSIAILVNDGVFDTFEIPADSTRTIAVDLAEDQTSTVIVRTVAGDLLGSADITVDCEEPQPEPIVTISHDCDDGGNVTVTNDGTDTVQIAIIVNDGVVDTFEIPAGDTRVIPIELPDGQSSTVLVRTVGGDPLATAEIPVDCSEPAGKPAVTITHSCAEGSVVTIDNTSTELVEVAIAVNGAVLDTYQVPAESIVEVDLELTEDETSLVEVRAIDGEVLADAEIAVDCIEEGLSAALDFDCEAGSAQVTLTNTGTSPVVFTILVNEVSTDVTVGPLSDGTFAFTTVDGESYTVVVGAGAQQLLRETIVDNCVDPVNPGTPDLTAVLTHDCGSAATVALTNPSADPVVFTVSVNGREVPVAVAAGTTGTFSFGVGEDISYQVTVAGPDGTTLLTDAFVYDCEPNTTVKPKQQKPGTPTLPRTGSDMLYSQLLAGLLLLCLGMIMVDVSRKRAVAAG